MALFATPIGHSVRLSREASPRRRAIGIFPCADFAAARQAMAELARHPEYQDWLDAREGSQFGRVMAGEDVVLARVAWRSYRQWCASAGVDPCEATLDAFAEIARDAREGGPPEARDLAARPTSPDARFGRADFVLANAIQARRFLDWCACVGLRPSREAAFRYAELLLEQWTEEPCEPACDSIGE